MIATKPVRKIPTGLLHEPLIDAVFEMRFDSSGPVASILPGLLYKDLQGDKEMEHLPIMSLPKEIRDTDPNFQYAPLIKVSWGMFWIFVGDKTFSVASKLPYPGFAAMLEAVELAYGIALNSGLIQRVTRCSYKNINFLDENLGVSRVDAFNLSLNIGGLVAGGQEYQIKADFQDGKYYHLIGLASPASTQLIGRAEPMNGHIIDIDSVESLKGESASQFLSSLSERVTSLHDANKDIVFSCFTDLTMEKLGATYD